MADAVAVSVLPGLVPDGDRSARARECRTRSGNGAAKRIRGAGDSPRAAWLSQPFCHTPPRRPAVRHVAALVALAGRVLAALALSLRLIVCGLATDNALVHARARRARACGLPV